MIRAFLFLLSLLSLSNVWASVEVTSRVSQTEVAIEGNLILTLRVRFEGEAQLGSPKLPDLTGFSVLNSWTNQSSSSRLMAGPNGMEFKTERAIEYNYNLRADRAGRQVIPPLEISVNAQTYKTDSIAVQVFEDAGQLSQRGPPQQGGSQGVPSDESDLDAIFNALLQRHVQPKQPKAPNVQNPNELFFIHLDVDKDQVYEGEQILASWYIYSRGNIISLDRLKFPELRGFWREILEEIPALRFVQETINGIPYRRALLASHALFPIRPGEVKIDEYRVRATVQVPVMGGLGGFSFGQPQAFNRSSPIKTFQVKPLPTPRPADFVGGVGQFSLRGEVALTPESKVQGPAEQAVTNDPTQAVPQQQVGVFSARMGEPFKWTLQFEGVGNAKMIELPKFELPEGLEWVETRTESRFFKNGRSVKNFEVFLIPKKTGLLDSVSAKFSLFDPSQGQYYQVSAEPFKLQVAEGLQGNFALSQAPSLAAVKDPEAKLSLPGPMLSGQKAGLPLILNFQVPSFVYLGLIFIGSLLFGIRWVRDWIFRNRPKDHLKELQSQLNLVRKLAKKNPREASQRVVQLTYEAMGLNENARFAANPLEEALMKLPPQLKDEVQASLQEDFSFFEKQAFDQAQQVENKIFQEHLRNLEKTLTTIVKRLV